MRILALPFVSDPVENDPYFVNLMDVINGFAKAGLRSWWHVVLPDEDSGYRFSGPDAGVNFCVHRVKANPIRVVEEFVPSAEFWSFVNQRKSPIVYDCVMNQRTALGPLVKKIVKAKTQKFSIDVPVFNLMTMIKTPFHASGKIDASMYGEDEVLLDLLCAYSDYAMVPDATRIEDLLECGRVYLRASKLDELRGRVCGAWFSGFEAERVMKMVQRREHEKVVVAYAGRWNKPQKRFDLVLQVMDMLRLDDRLKFVCTSGDFGDEKQIEELKAEHPHVEFKILRRDEHLANVGNLDVFVYCSAAESFPVTVAEMLVGGVVGVFLDAPWVRRDYATYPFVAAGLENAAAMVRWVAGNLDEARRKIAPVVEELVQRDKSLDRFERMSTFMTEKIEQRMTNSGGSLGNLVKQALVACSLDVGGADVKESMLYERMTQMSESGREFGRKGDMMSRFYLRRLVQGCGWEDVCDGPEVKYRQKEVVHESRGNRSG